MLKDSELQFCKQYHLSKSKDLGDIANILMWPIGKVIHYKAVCESKGYIIDDEVVGLALANIKIIEELDVKGMK